MRLFVFLFVGLVFVCAVLHFGFEFCCLFSLVVAGCCDALLLVVLILGGLLLLGCLFDFGWLGS